MKSVIGLRNDVPGSTCRMSLKIPRHKTYWISLAFLGLPTVIGLPSLLDIAMTGSGFPASLPVIAAIDVGANLTASGALVASLCRWQIKPSVVRLATWAKLIGLTLVGNMSLLTLTPSMNSWFPERIDTPVSILMATAAAGLTWIVGKRALRIPDEILQLDDETECLKQEYRLALRETGQLLMLCALPRTPYQATAVLKQRRFLGVDLGTHGYVEFRRYAENFTGATGERDMLIFLAGMSAERTFLGMVGQGGQGDMASWVMTAERYLSGGFSSPYYPHPTSEMQSGHNAQILSELLQTSQECCDAFMQHNHQLILQLAHVLLERRELSLTDLLPLKSAIALPGELLQLMGTLGINAGKLFQPKGVVA